MENIVTRNVTRKARLRSLAIKKEDLLLPVAMPQPKPQETAKEKYLDTGGRNASRNESGMRNKRRWRAKSSEYSPLGEETETGESSKKAKKQKSKESKKEKRRVRALRRKAIPSQRSARRPRIPRAGSKNRDVSRRKRRMTRSPQARSLPITGTCKPRFGGFVNPISTRSYLGNPY